MNFNFTLKMEEYIDFLSYQISSSKKMRGWRWFLVTGVPAVLITGVLLLRIRQWMFIAVILAVAFLWVLYGAKAVWKRYIRRRIRRQVIPQMHIESFREVSYHFGKDGLEFQDNGIKKKIGYGQMAMAAYSSGFALAYQGGAVLIPFRVFENDTERKEFVKQFEMSRHLATAG